MDINFVLKGIAAAKLKNVASVVVERCENGEFYDSTGETLFPLSVLPEADLASTLDGDNHYWVRADERESGIYVQIALWGDSLEVIWFPGQAFLEWIRVNSRISPARPQLDLR